MQGKRFTEEFKLEAVKLITERGVSVRVILPFLTGIGSRVHAAMANRCFGVNPPKIMFGRS